MKKKLERIAIFVAALSNNNKEIIERYSYDVFGKVTIKDGDGEVNDVSAYGNEYFFTGRRLDYETGNYYYRFRYYNPDIGRFLQPDPIGYDDGMNIYTYVGNNPLNWIDPLGLCKEDTEFENLMKTVQEQLELDELISNYREKMDVLRENKHWWRSSDYMHCYQYAEEILDMNLNTENYQLRELWGRKSWLGFGKPIVISDTPAGSHNFIGVFHKDSNSPLDPIVILDPWIPGSFGNYYTPDGIYNYKNYSRPEIIYYYP
ncbi:MAG: hypothetical protein GF364_03455 [Candidatus Lokiarchaeota archaeon]|nr:hypothetical protein [Candidatus Lokiarchaeota archaeon]